MASSLKNSAYNNAIQKYRKPLSPSPCILLFAVFSTEYLTVVILNLLTIIVFVKQRQLQNQSKYLIIHQARVNTWSSTIALSLGRVGVRASDDWMERKLQLWSVGVQ